MLVKTLMVILLISIALSPNTEAASLEPTQTNSVSNTPSFSSSLSVSFSASATYSTSSAASISGTTSATVSMFTNSLTTSISPTFSTGLSLTPSGTFSAASSGTFSALPSSFYFLNNHCPFQAETICPFWGPDVFPRYRVVVMNTNGSMLTIDNVDIQSFEVPQYPLSALSTNGFITTGQTYRISVFGCDAAGINCVQPWTPITVPLNIKERALCKKNACNILCTIPTSGLIRCTWANKAPRLRRVILKVKACYDLNRIGATIALPSPSRYISPKRFPTPLPSSAQLNLPVNALCEVVLILRYPDVQIQYPTAVFTS